MKRSREFCAGVFAASGTIGALVLGGCGTTTSREAKTPTPSHTWTASLTPTETPCPGADWIYVAGGDALGPAFAGVLSAQVDGCGNVRGWRATSPLPSGWEGSLMAAATDPSGFVFLAGGTDSGAFTTFQNNVRVGAFTAGDVTAWTNVAPLPVFRAGAAAAATGGYLYVTGGRSALAAAADVRYAGTASGGLVGSWMGATALPTPVWLHGAFAGASHLYAAGGRLEVGTYSDAVFSTAIGRDGELGAWTSLAALPYGVGAAAWTVADGYAIFAGGRPSTVSTGVFSAPLLAGGAIGVWTSQPPLPAPGVSYAAMAKASVGGQTYLFVSGGWNGGGGAYSAVYRAAFSTGVVSPWVRVADLPAPRNDHVSFP